MSKNVQLSKQGMFDLACEAKALMESAGYNPIVAMMEMAQDKEIPSRCRLECHKELVKYYYPAMGSVPSSEGANQSSGNVYVQIQNFNKPVQLQQGDARTLSDVTNIVEKQLEKNL